MRQRRKRGGYEKMREKKDRGRERENTEITEEKKRRGEN